MLKEKILNTIRRICGTKMLQEQITRLEQHVASINSLPNSISVQQDDFEKINLNNQALQLTILNAILNRHEDIFIPVKGDAHTPEKYLRLERTLDGGLCFKKNQNDLIQNIKHVNDGKVFVTTLPKTGTYFLGRILTLLGYETSGMHSVGTYIADQRATDHNKHNNIMVDHYILPFALQWQLCQNGQFLLAHSPFWCSAYLNNAKKIVTVRNFRNSCVSMMRNRQKMVNLSLPYSSLGYTEEALLTFLNSTNEIFDMAREHLKWIEAFPDAVIKFEELASSTLSNDLVSIINLANILERTPQDIIEAVENARGAQTITFSGKNSNFEEIWSDRVEAKFVELGGDVINEQFGYERYWKKQQKHL